MPNVDPNAVMLTGENPFIRLSATDGSPNTTEASFWRITFAPGFDSARRMVAPIRPRRASGVSPFRRVDPGTFSISRASSLRGNCASMPTILP